jgi:protein involved in polysaccharide export with SLBB domain
MRSLPPAFLNKHGGRSRRRTLLLALLLCVSPMGCAAMSNPMLDGIPARRVPPELLAPSRAGEQTIPLTLLRQPPTDIYRLAPGDVLGIYVEGFLGDRNLPLPLHVGPHVRLREQQNLPPAAGFPVTVQDDGTVALPGVSSLSLKGLSLPEAREAIRKHYFKEKRLLPETERILVSLLYPRRAQVLVFRQETPVFVNSLEGPSPGSKRGTGHLVDLPAYENDVLHVLAVTGGLPGLDVYNEIVIFRDCFKDDEGRAIVQQQLEAGGGQPGALQAVCPRTSTIRIPLRLPAGQPPPLHPQDVVLHTGDVVLLEARDPDLFYTAGLLPTGMHVLPRDHDLDVLEAIALVRGPLFNGAFGGSNLSGALIQAGLGNPSPSLLSVVRRSPDGRQVVINVDLRRAVHDPQERLVVKAGDILFLQEQPGEALTRYLSQTFFNFNLYWEAVRSSNAAGIINVATPDRLSQQTGNVTFNR